MRVFFQLSTPRKALLLAQCCFGKFAGTVEADDGLQQKVAANVLRVLAEVQQKGAQSVTSLPERIMVRTELVYNMIPERIRMGFHAIPHRNLTYSVNPYVQIV